jgi:LuxR family maltose regulon positive regulatory protein
LEEDSCIAKLLPSIRSLAPGFIDTLLQKYKEDLPENSRCVTAKPVNKQESTGTELIEPLSDRELEVLKLMAAGLSNKEIADKLYISIGTTKWHITNIFSKLHSRKIFIIIRSAILTGAK